MSMGSSKDIDDLLNEITVSHARYQSQPPKIAHQTVPLQDPAAHTKIADAVQREFDGHADIYINNAAISDRTILAISKQKHWTGYCYAIFELR